MHETTYRYAPRVDIAYHWLPDAAVGNAQQVADTT